MFLLLLEKGLSRREVRQEEKEEELARVQVPQYDARSTELWAGQTIALSEQTLTT